MSRNIGRQSKSVDWIFLSVFFSLLIIGWMMLYAAVYDSDTPYAFLDFNTIIGRQTIWVGIAILAFIVVYTFDWNFWSTFSIPIYGTCIVLLILVLLLGTEIKGAKSWFIVFGFSFQPSEIAKFGTALALSSYLSSYKSDIKTRQSFLVSLAIILVPMLLILLQPDAGSAIVFLSFSILFYKRGLSPLYYIIGFFVAAIFIFSLIYDPKIVTLGVLLLGSGIMMYNYFASVRNAGIFLAFASLSILFYVRDLYIISIGIPILAIIIYAIFFTRDRNFKTMSILLPAIILSIGLSFGSQYVVNNVIAKHQQERINVWLNPEKSDPQGPRYNIIQSKKAIGSGGLQGKGFLKGDMTNLNYVPEQTTDFIFSTVGEEQGFVGSMGVILLFGLLITRIVIMAERAKNLFIQNYAYAVAGIFFIHVMVNIGMAVGLMPVVGIPLPFLSKGGSALLGFTILLAALLKMDNARFR